MLPEYFEYQQICTRKCIWAHFVADCVGATGVYGSMAKPVGATGVYGPMAKPCIKRDRQVQNHARTTMSCRKPCIVHPMYKRIFCIDIDIDIAITIAVAIDIDTHIDIDIDMYIYVYMYVCVYVCIVVCMHVCVYI